MQEYIWRLVSLYKYLYICLCWYHLHILSNVITPVPEFLPQLLNVLVQFLQIVLYKVDLGIITILDPIQDRFIRSFEHIDSHIEFVKASQVFVLGYICFDCLLGKLFILDAYIGLVVGGALAVFSVGVSEEGTGYILVGLLKLLELVHLVVVVFFGEEHLGSFLVELVPELGGLLY